MSDAKRSGPEPVVPLKGEDAFWLTDLYPDPKALFEHGHASMNDVAEDCIVVLDANVLLLPFEITKASVGEVERVYTQLAKDGRLIVPGQAAREFYKHRSRKIAAIADAIDAAITKARKQIFEKPIALLEDDEDYRAARELGAEVITKGEEVAKKLMAVNERLQNEIGDDRVSALYRKLLGGCIAEVEIAVEDRKSVVDEVARRARLQIAPGFKDQQKEDGGIGDYLVWRAILQEAERRKTHCIFVTEEQKADWWIKRHGAFQPRPELIEEYRRASDGKSIHLVPLSGLLAQFKATETTISEVKSHEEERRKFSLVEADDDARVQFLVHNNIRHRVRELRRLKHDLARTENQIADLEMSIHQSDPAGVPDKEWELLRSLSVRRVELADEIAKYEAKYDIDAAVYDDAQRKWTKLSSIARGVD